MIMYTVVEIEGGKVVSVGSSPSKGTAERIFDQSRETVMDVRLYEIDLVSVTIKLIRWSAQ